MGLFSGIGMRQWMYNYQKWLSPTFKTPRRCFGHYYWWYSLRLDTYCQLYNFICFIWQIIRFCLVGRRNSPKKCEATHCRDVLKIIIMIIIFMKIIFIIQLSQKIEGQLLTCKTLWNPTWDFIWFKIYSNVLGIGLPQKRWKSTTFEW